MTGYERGPDYGGPEPSWREAVIIMVVIAAVAAGVRGGVS